MDMIDKLDKLLLDLENPEIFNEFVDDYHKFVDEGSDKLEISYQQSFSPNFSDSILLESLNKSMELIGKIFGESIKQIEFKKILNETIVDIEENNQYDNDYTPENITEFKMKVTADSIDYTTLKNAA